VSVLSKSRIETAGTLLWQHWQDGTAMDALPADCRPETRAEGYAIQALLEGRSRAPLVGWKIAATSTAGQSHIGVDGPLAGRLIAERAAESGAVLPSGGNRMSVAEPEFAFRMGRDLPPRDAAYTVDDVVAAVATLHPAIEMPDSRFTDFAAAGAAQLIADNACAHQFVLGPATTADWRAADLSRHAARGTVSSGLTREGSGAAVLDDPRLALAWLANELSGLGITLRAGQVVTTGTCMQPLAFAPGDRVEADFGDFGTVSVGFDAA
jgi:2-keto-4-pentenoate hydratase